MKLSDLKDYEVEEAAPSQGGMKLSDLKDDYEVESAEQPRLPAQESDIGIGDAILDQGMQGITGGFADELGAAIHQPAGGAKALLGLLGMDNSEDADVQAYTKDRDARRQYSDAVTEAHPYVGMAANIAGSIVPGMGLAGLVGKTAQAGNWIGRIANAAKVGALSGGTTAVGTSRADLAKGEVGDLAKQTIEGTGLGMGTGAVVQGGIESVKGLSSLLKSLKKTRTVENFNAAKGFGEEGTDILTQQGVRDAENALEPQMENLAKKGLEGFDRTSAKFDAARKAIDSANRSFDIRDKVKIIDDAIAAARLSDDVAAQSDIEALEYALSNFKNGKPSVPVEFSPVKTVTTKGAPSTVFDEFEVPKVKGSFENSPEGFQKAQSALAKLQGKAKLENNTDAVYEIVDDMEHGFFRVLEKTPKQIETVMPSAPINRIVPDGGTSSFTTRSAPLNPEAATRGQTQDLLNTLNRMSGGYKNTPKLETEPMIGSLKGAAKGMKGILKEAPELAEANSDWQNVSMFFKELGVDGKAAFDVVDGKKVLTPGARSKLINELRRIGTDSSAGINSRTKINKAIEYLEKVMPDEVSVLKPQLEKAATRLDLAQKAQDIKPFRGSIFEKGPIWAGNKAGSSIRYLKDTTPQELQDLAKMFAQMGGAGARLAKSLGEIAGKDDQGRNALLFSLQQQPWARELLDKNLSGSNDK